MDVLESDAAIAGTDYTALAAEQVSFVAGEVTKDVMLSTLSDVLTEGTERLQVTISVSGVLAGLGEVSKATIYILDADSPGTYERDTSNNQHVIWISLY